MNVHPQYKHFISLLEACLLLSAMVVGFPLLAQDSYDREAAQELTHTLDETWQEFSKTVPENGWVTNPSEFRKTTIPWDEVVVLSAFHQAFLLKQKNDYQKYFPPPLTTNDFFLPPTLHLIVDPLLHSEALASLVETNFAHPINTLYRWPATLLTPIQESAYQWLMNKLRSKCAAGDGLPNATFYYGPPLKELAKTPLESEPSMALLTNKKKWELRFFVLNNASRYALYHEYGHFLQIADYIQQGRRPLQGFVDLQKKTTDQVPIVYFLVEAEIYLEMIASRSVDSSLQAESLLDRFHSLLNLLSYLKPIQELLKRNGLDDDQAVRRFLKSQYVLDDPEAQKFVHALFERLAWSKIFAALEQAEARLEQLTRQPLMIYLPQDLALAAGAGHSFLIDLARANNLDPIWGKPLPSPQK